VLLDKYPAKILNRIGYEMGFVKMNKEFGAGVQGLGTLVSFPFDFRVETLVTQRCKE
jgi:hypothetical protein